MAGQRGLPIGVGASVVVAGVGLGLIRFLGEAPPGRNLEAAVGATAFGAVIATPGVLALLAPRDRPALLVPAALLLIPLSFLSFALVTLPLLIPAFLLLRAHHRSAPTGSALRTAAVTTAVVALLVAALASLFAQQDPRELRSGAVTYGTSDIVTYGEALLSLALSASAVLTGWTFGSGAASTCAPRGPRPPDLQAPRRDQGGATRWTRPSRRC